MVSRRLVLEDCWKENTIRKEEVIFTLFETIAAIVIYLNTSNFGKFPQAVK